MCAIRSTASPPPGKRGVRGRESGAVRRVSPRTTRTWNSPAVKHFRASRNKLGTRRSGAEMRRGLSAKKREEPFVFPRLSSPPARVRRRARHNRCPPPGTGTCRTQGGGGRRIRPPRPWSRRFSREPPPPTGWHHQEGGQLLLRPYQYRNAIPASRTRNPIFLSCS